MKEDLVNESPLSIIKDLIIGLLKVILVLIVFVVGVVIGLASSSNSYRYFTFQVDRPVIANYVLADTVSKDSGNCTVCEKVDCLSMGSFVRPKIFSHGMSDDELFWRASLVPNKAEYPFKRVPKVAFMFLTRRGKLPLLPLWERFFQGQDVNKYSIYVYAPPGYVLSVSNTSAFYDRQILSQHAKWGSLTLVDAEKRVLANALLDFANERFVLLSESCIPIYYFPTVYEYLTGSIHSFVETYDDAPDIQLSDQRRALQCFELNRKLAVRVVSDTKCNNI